MSKSFVPVIVVVWVMGLIVFLGYVISYDAGLDLVKAADQGDLQRVQSLLKKGTPLNARDSYGYTALNRAVEKGRIEIVKLLLDNGADPDKNLSLMLVHSVDVAKLLLERGADVNSECMDCDTPLIIAAAGGVRVFMPFRVPNGSNVELVELLLARGADINAKGRSGTPLTAAAASCNTKMVKLLLTKGAFVNARETCGETALFCATLGGCVDTVKLLLEHGADVNLKDHWGVTPLMLTRRNPWDLQIIRDTHPTRNSDTCVRLSGMSLRPADAPPDEELVDLLKAYGAKE